MILSKSPKTYQNFKCDYPKNTINNIEKGFQKLGLKIEYKKNKISTFDIDIHVGSTIVNILGWSQHGKGMSEILAKASAYAELAERFSTGFIEIKIPFPKKTEKYQNLLSKINSRNFLKGFSKEENSLWTSFENINKFFYNNLSKDMYNYLKNEELLNYLVDSYSLIEERYVKIPIYLAEFISLSNGIASGNTIEEAISQASFEIFERYAAGRVVSERIECPTINDDSINDKKIRKCIDLFKSLKIDIIIKDFSLGLKIPVIGVIFINKNITKDSNKLTKERNYMRLNAGSHLDINEAILRCFIEYLQTVHWDRDEIIKQTESEVLYDIWVKKLGMVYTGPENPHRYFTRFYDYYSDLSFLKRGKIISIKDLNSLKNDDCLDDIKKIIDICRNNKWDIQIINYTHKILNFPTVRVIIPGVSTDFDVYFRKIINIKDFENRINQLYGIENFFFYINNDNWINDKNEILKVIKILEDYLSKELFYYNFYLNRENNFGQIINIFHVLPYLYMSINRLNEAKRYFEALIELDYKPSTDSSFLKSLYKTKYNPKIYKKNINIINTTIKGQSKRDFKLSENPFNPEYCDESAEKMYISLLKNIDKTFN